MSATHVGQVIDALVTTFASLTPATEDGQPVTLEVIDGQPVQLNAKDVVVVGFATDRLAADITQDRPGLDKNHRQEDVTVVCLASAWRGGKSMKIVRDRCVGILNEVQTLLAANRSLGGVVRRAELGYELSLDQAQTKDGPTATIRFVVRATTL